MSKRLSWQLPAGVSRGNWDYAQSPDIAQQYDESLAGSGLFDYDEAIVSQYFTTPGVVADFGCGTGRALIPLLREGHHGLAIDLSHEMLRQVAEKAAGEALPVTLVQSNLVECTAVNDMVADYGMCLFSTLGMIRGHEHRLQALREMHRIIRPNGVFVIHVHNLWYNLYDPGGPWWLFKNIWQSWRSSEIELGDKFFDYRQIAKMFLHVFRRGEICGALRDAGFQIQQVIPLSPSRYAPLRAAWCFSNLRANGWIIVARRS
jgi:SAM-dependent methyltransferase